MKIKLQDDVLDILDGMIKTGCATNRPEAIRQVILLYKSCLDHSCEKVRSQVLTSK